MTTTTVKSATWQKRRSDYNHGWLKNSFCTGELERWSGFVHDRVEGGSFSLRDFNSNISDEWTARGPEALDLAKEYRESMSPGTLLDYEPLIKMDAETKSWLRPLCAAIWEQKYTFRKKVAHVTTAYKNADTAFQNLKMVAGQLDDGTVIKDSAFAEQFTMFQKNCRQLGEAIHNLETSVKV